MSSISTSVPGPEASPYRGSSSGHTAELAEAAHEYYAAFPLVDVPVFGGARRAKYAIGLVAAGEGVRLEPGVKPMGELFNPEVERAWNQLRYASYKSLGWTHEQPDAHGAEQADLHDKVSLQVAVLKNMGRQPDGRDARVIGGARLILGGLGIPLPVESKFDIIPDAGATEISRMIAVRPQTAEEMAEKRWRSPVRGEARVVYAAIQRGLIGIGRKQGYKSAFGMTEEYLIKSLEECGLPFERLTDYIETPEYANTKNALIFVSQAAVAARVRIGNPHVPFTTKLFFHGVERNQGQGFYYDKNMVLRLKG